MSSSGRADDIPDKWTIAEHSIRFYRLFMAVQRFRLKLAFVKRR